MFGNNKENEMQRSKKNMVQPQKLLDIKQKEVLSCQSKEVKQRSKALTSHFLSEMIRNIPYVNNVSFMPGQSLTF